MQSDFESTTNAFERVHGLYHELAIRPTSLIRTVGSRKCEEWKRQTKAEIRRILREQGLTVGDYEKSVRRLE